MEGKINNRNSNIDMIRIVAMLLVVALHCMDYGGFRACETFSVK